LFTLRLPALLDQLRHYRPAGIIGRRSKQGFQKTKAHGQIGQLGVRSINLTGADRALPSDMRRVNSETRFRQHN
jgi:hypothetical protein